MSTPPYQNPYNEFIQKMNPNSQMQPPNQLVDTGRVRPTSQVSAVLGPQPNGTWNASDTSMGPSISASSTFFDQSNSVGPNLATEGQSVGFLPGRLINPSPSSGGVAQHPEPHPFSTHLHAPYGYGNPPAEMEEHHHRKVSFQPTAVGAGPEGIPQQTGNRAPGSAPQATTSFTTSTSARILKNGHQIVGGAPSTQSGNANRPYTPGTHIPETFYEHHSGPVHGDLIQNQYYTTHQTIHGKVTLQNKHMHENGYHASPTGGNSNSHPSMLNYGTSNQYHQFSPHPADQNHGPIPGAVPRGGFPPHDAAQGFHQKDSHMQSGTLGSQLPADQTPTFDQGQLPPASPPQIRPSKMQRGVGRRANKPPASQWSNLASYQPQFDHDIAAGVRYMQRITHLPPPRSDPTIADVEANAAFWKNEINAALLNMVGIVKLPTKKGFLKPWTDGRPECSYKHFEAVACTILTELINFSKYGFRGGLLKYERVCMREDHDEDRLANCIERTKLVIEQLRIEKTICEDVLKSVEAIRKLVYAPIHTFTEKWNNRKSNEKRSETNNDRNTKIAAIEELEKQGVLLTTGQTTPTDAPSQAEQPDTQNPGKKRKRSSHQGEREDQGDHSQQESPTSPNSKRIRSSAREARE